MLIASPLSRALMTANLAFEGSYDGPREVCALARERIFHASDVGRAPEAIAEDFPGRVVTPGGCQMCYVDHTGCHQLNRVLTIHPTSVLSLPGGS